MVANGQQRRSNASAQRPAAAAQKKKGTPAAQRKKGTPARPKKKGGSQPATVEDLKSQRQQIQRQISEQRRLLRSNEQKVRQRLRNLMVINTEIEDKRRTIDTIRRDIGRLDVEIDTLSAQMERLQQQLQVCKDNYVRSMRYMHRNRSLQSQLMFIFSADNLWQMARRLRFIREYASYQRTQGEEIKRRQVEIDQQLQAISVAHSQKRQLLSQGERERHELEDRQNEQQQVVTTLKRQQKTIQAIIAEQQKKDAALNAQIDRLIAEEIARQKARAEAEARRRAAAEAEAARRRAAEEARRKAEAEAAAANSSKPGSSASSAASRRKSRSTTPTPSRSTAVAAASPSANDKPVAMSVPNDDVRISGNFESNRGRLPIPVAGRYSIVSHFGQYDVEGLHGVTLDNKGINIQAERGAAVRCIFDGEVSAVFSFGGSMVVMVRHGKYISVYCNVTGVCVQRGQKVSTRQTIGRVAGDNILQFQLRRETAKLNPESWLGR